MTIIKIKINKKDLDESRYMIDSLLQSDDMSQSCADLLLSVLKGIDEKR